MTPSPGWRPAAAAGGADLAASGGADEEANAHLHAAVVKPQAAMPELSPPRAAAAAGEARPAAPAASTAAAAVQLQAFVAATTAHAVAALSRQNSSLDPGAAGDHHHLPPAAPGALDSAALASAHALAYANALAQAHASIVAASLVSMQDGGGAHPPALPFATPQQQHSDPSSAATATATAGLEDPGPATPSKPRPKAKGKGRSPKGKGKVEMKPKRAGSSKFRGVSQHKLTGRWEASLWVEKKQVYLGGFNTEAKAAWAHDLAALHTKGEAAKTNLPADVYDDELAKMQDWALKDVVAHLRRQSSAFSRGKSKYRGVSGHKAASNFNRPWEARIGSLNGRKNVFLGLFETEEAAARQYDRALIVSKGLSAKTNFDVEDYRPEAEAWAAAGGGAGPAGPAGSPAGSEDTVHVPMAEGPAAPHATPWSGGRGKKRSRTVPDLKAGLQRAFGL